MENTRPLMPGGVSPLFEFFCDRCFWTLPFLPLEVLECTPDATMSEMATIFCQLQNHSLPWLMVYVLKLMMESGRRKGNNNDNEGRGEKGGYRRTPTQDTPLPLLHITHLLTLAALLCCAVKSVDMHNRSEGQLRVLEKCNCQLETINASVLHV